MFFPQDFGIFCPPSLGTTDAGMLIPPLRTSSQASKMLLGLGRYLQVPRAPPGESVLSSLPGGLCYKVPHHPEKYFSQAPLQEHLCRMGPLKQRMVPKGDEAEKPPWNVWGAWKSSPHHQYQIQRKQRKGISNSKLSCFLHSPGMEWDALPELCW